MAVDRIAILDGVVTARCDDGSEMTFGGAEDPRTLALLALNAPKDVPAKVLCRDEPVREGVALQQRIARLRSCGLPIPRGTLRRGYRLDIDPNRVDAQRLLAAARVDRAQHTLETVTDALRMWVSGPPDFLQSTPWWDELHLAKTKLEDLRSALRQRRLLIVEDQVGARLMRLLGEFDCTLVPSVEEFWPLYRRGLDDQFDAALVDLHLSPSYNDKDGLLVAGAISRSRLRIPVVLMTLEPLRDITHNDLCTQYNLDDVVLKTGDSETSDFHTIVEKVRSLFEDDRADVDARTIARIQAELPRLRTFARKWLIEQGRQGDIPRMEAMHLDLYRLSYGDDLAALREARDRFKSSFGLPGPREMQR